ncbi:coiled-coil domain-containing protein 183-like [Aplochiton taeniatus]
MSSYSDGESRGLDVELPKIQTLQDQRLRIEQLEKQTQAEYIAAKEILEHDQKLKSEDCNLHSVPFPKPGPTLESKVEQERCRMHNLIEQHNGLSYALRAKESQLLELEQSVKAVEMDSTPDNDEQQFDQVMARVRQLENTLEKMSIKITEAEKIHTTYLQVQDHLSMEVREMPMLLDHLQNTVFQGQAELCKVAEMSQTAVAAGDITKHHAPIPSTPQALVKLVEDVDALTEALSCTDLQELELRLVSQKATMEQLYIQVTQTEELVKQRADILAALELQYARLKFSVGPGSEKFDQLKEEMEMERRQEVGRLGNSMEKLGKVQAVLNGVEQGINNLYYSTVCVPLPEGTHSKDDGLDAMDKLRDIIIRLPILQAKVPLAEDASPDPEKVWAFLENSILHEPKNIKRASSPTLDSASEDTFQFRSQEEDSSLSREEIKRRSLQLIEALQPKKKAPKAAKKT